MYGKAQCASLGARGQKNLQQNIEEVRLKKNSLMIKNRLGFNSCCRLFEGASTGIAPSRVAWAQGYMQLVTPSVVQTALSTDSSS